MWPFSWTNYIFATVNDWIFHIMSSVCALTVFFTLYTGLVGAIISYVYFKKHKDSLNGYMNAIKHSPMVTQLMIKFWVDLHYSIKYNVNLILYTKKSNRQADNNEALENLLDDQIVLDEHQVLFEATTLFFLTSTKNFFRFR